MGEESQSSVGFGIKRETQFGFSRRLTCLLEGSRTPLAWLIRKKNNQSLVLHPQELSALGAFISRVRRLLTLSKVIKKSRSSPARPMTE